MGFEPFDDVGRRWGDSDFNRKGTFWRDEYNDISIGAILVMVFVPMGIIGGLGIYGSIIHSIEIETAITDLGSDNNPCLDLKADNYVVIDTYYHDSCKKVVVHYLNQLGYRPMPNTDLAGKKVTLFSGDIIPTIINNNTK